MTIKEKLIKIPPVVLLGLKKKGCVTPGMILKTVCLFFDIKEEDILKTKGRVKKENIYGQKVLLAKHIYCYIARYDFNITLKSIAIEAGFKDHTTAIFASEKILKSFINKNKTEDDEEIIRIVEDIQIRLKYNI